MPDNNRLLVGNHSKDDAAVYDIGNGQALISTTDFFMPIVDDPYNFGRIASANAISDVYAMGGNPILAIAILGWPINVLSPDIAALVIDGAKSICIEAGIALGGGHSIDAPEPIFGLAVNGLVNINNIKQNNTAHPGDLLFLTKPLGVGILTTAEKKALLKAEHKEIAANQMMMLNKVGSQLGQLPEVNAMTDVTGFGLLGHLTEMCEGSNVSAEIIFNNIPHIVDDLQYYFDQNCIPGGTSRNLNAYGHHVHSSLATDEQNALHLLADPQTSGGLLVSVNPTDIQSFVDVLKRNGLDRFTQPVGRILERNEQLIRVK
jgi:selenide, water dikinase